MAAFGRASSNASRLPFPFHTAQYGRTYHAESRAEKRFKGFTLGYITPWCARAGGELGHVRRVVELVKRRDTNCVLLCSLSMASQRAGRMLMQHAHRRPCMQRSWLRTLHMCALVI